MAFLFYKYTFGTCFLSDFSIQSFKFLLNKKALHKSQCTKSRKYYKEFKKYTTEEKDYKEN
jgi:hypothetical protein